MDASVTENAASPPSLSPTPHFASLRAITGDENLLILVSAPGEEALCCGGLIAEACQRGRPPFVIVLGDGTATHPHSAAYPPDRLANLHDRETRAALACLGLPPGRLLMAGVHDGAIPLGGAAFDAVVRAVTLVMWARDCNVICAPWPGPDRNGVVHVQGAAWTIARAVAAASGVGLLACAAGGAPAGAGGTWRLDITRHLGAKRAAVAAHASQLGQVVLDDPAPRLFDQDVAACACPRETLLRAGS